MPLPKVPEKLIYAEGTHNMLPVRINPTNEEIVDKLNELITAFSQLVDYVRGREGTQSNCVQICTCDQETYDEEGGYVHQICPIHDLQPEVTTTATSVFPSQEPPQRTNFLFYGSFAVCPMSGKREKTCPDGFPLEEGIWIKPQEKEYVGFKPLEVSDEKPRLMTDSEVENLTQEKNKLTNISKEEAEQLEREGKVVILPQEKECPAGKEKHDEYVKYHGYCSHCGEKNKDWHETGCATNAEPRDFGHMGCTCSASKESSPSQQIDVHFLLIQYAELYAKKSMYDRRDESLIAYNGEAVEKCLSQIEEIIKQAIK